MRQRGPARINNALLPLRENLKPRIEMKLQIVSRRSTKKEKGNFHRDGRTRDRKERCPQQGRLAPGNTARFLERMFRRAVLAQTVPSFRRSHCGPTKTPDSLHLTETQHGRNLRKWSSTSVFAVEKVGVRSCAR